MNNRQIAISAILSLVLLVAAALIFQSLKSSKESTVSDNTATSITREVSVEQFPPQNTPRVVELDGRLSGYEKITIGAEVTGRLLKGSRVYQAGSTFRHGDLLFQVDSRDERFNLYALRSNFLNAISQMMPDLKFDHPASFENWKKYLDEFDVEQTLPPLPEISSEQEKYYLAGKNIFNLYYNIKSQEDQLSNHNIYAPFSGVFLSVNAYPGTLISPGMSLGQIMNTSRFELAAPVAMADLTYVKTGQNVELYANDLGKKWTGTVSRISDQIDQATQSVPVYIAVQGSGLKDGVFVKGRLKGLPISESSVLPRSLVSEDVVWLYDNGKARSKTVEIVSRSEQTVHIRGLDKEDLVIVSGTNNLYEGQDLILSK